MRILISYLYFDNNHRCEILTFPHKKKLAKSKIKMFGTFRAWNRRVIFLSSFVSHMQYFCGSSICAEANPASQKLKVVD